MTDLQRWHEIKEIVQEILDSPPEERDQCLDLACGVDEALRGEVEALLAVSSTRADFFDDFQVLPPSMQTPTLKEGEDIGAYRIIREIGRGGMGAVYLAEDTEHGRQVALKTMPRRSQRTLLHEKRLLAKLQHPNIATLYDSGYTKDGFGYFVMEYVEGVPVTTFCDTHQITLRERLGLFLKTCDAVSFAHRNLVVHRDLKPKNILVTADGQPKLLDFGIAKLLLAEQDFSVHGDKFFTMAFASPEQLAGEHTTTATDIYSLGILLCLLLAGRLPYTVETYEGLPWAIRNLPPEKPSALVMKGAVGLDNETDLARRTTSKKARHLRGDLDAIVLRALRKEPDNRYQTVGELAGDVQNFLSRRPVAARRATRRYRLSKFCRRNAAPVTAAILITIVIAVMSFSLARQYRRAIRGEQLASTHAERTRQINRFVVDIFQRTNPFSQDNSSGSSVEDLLQQSSISVESSLNNYPTLKAPLLSVLGEIFLARGDQKKARQLLLSALAIQRRGPRDLELALTFHRYGLLLTAEGHYQESDTALAEAQNIIAGLRDQRDPVFAARIQMAQATNKINEADYNSAQPLYESAIASLAQRPEALPELSTSLFGLAKLLDLKDRDAEAETLYLRALATAEAMPEPRNPNAAAVSNALGTMMSQRGDYTGARKMFFRALDIIRETLGTENATYEIILHNIAALASQQGHYKEAVERLTEVLALEQRHTAPNHVRVLTTKNELAGALIQLREYAQAEKILAEIIALEEAVLPENHPTRATAINNLAALYQSTGRFQEASLLSRQALPIFTKLVGRESRPVATILGNLGVIAFSLGDTRQAEAYYLDSLEITRSIDDNENPGAILVMANLVSLYLAAGDLESAQAVLAEAKSTASAVVGPSDWLMGYVELLEAKTLFAQSNFRDAASRARHARDILAAQLPQQDWRIAMADNVLGASLGKTGQVGEAEKLLVHSLASLRSTKGEAAISTQEAIKNIREFYNDQGRDDEAAAYRLKRD